MTEAKGIFCISFAGQLYGLLPFNWEVAEVERHVTIAPCRGIGLYGQRSYPLCIGRDISKEKLDFDVGITLNGGLDIFHITKLLMAVRLRSW